MVAKIVLLNVESVSSVTDDCEIVLSNDSTLDNLGAEMVKQCARNSNVKGVNSRKV